MEEKTMVTASEIATILGVSVGHAYKLIRVMNAELEKNGFITVAGKVPRTMWNRKFFNESSNLGQLKEVG